MGENCELEMISGGCDKDCHRRRFKTKLIAMGMCGYDRVIVEPSGIFDVDEFFDILHEEPLNRWYQIGNVIAIVDSKLERDLSEEADFILASEVADAGCIVMSKSQDASPEEIQGTIEHVNQALEKVHCSRRFHCEMNGVDTANVIHKNWDEMSKEDFDQIADCGYEILSMKEAGIQADIVEDGKTFEEYVKDQIRVKLIRVRCMNAMAKEKGIVLGREEKDGVKKAAEKYYNALTEEQRSRYNITEDKLNQMFTEFAIAQKLYNDQTSLMDIEISADDSRVINIQYIVTDSKDEIEKAYAELKEGNSFFAIAKKYNSDGEYEYELRRGEMDSKFEEAAYALSTGEMSSIVEAEGKYYIIRCTSDNDKAKTEVNKSAILADKKLAAFNEKFEEYEAGKYVEWNDSEWEKLSVSSAVIYNVKFEDTFNTITIN